MITTTKGSIILKVISKRQDYWEYLIKQWGVEKGHNIPTWVRNREILDNSDDVYKKIKSLLNDQLKLYSLSFKADNAEVYYMGIVFIAGVGYPFIQIGKEDPRYIYHIDPLMAELREKTFHGYGKSIVTKMVIKRFKTFLDMKFTHNFPIPTLVVTTERENITKNYYRDIIVVEINSVLSDYHFSKVLSPQDAFMKIEPFVGFHFSQENKTVSIANNDRLEAHGFDKKKSFRHR